MKRVDIETGKKLVAVLNTEHCGLFQLACVKAHGFTVTHDPGGYRDGPRYTYEFNPRESGGLDWACTVGSTDEYDPGIVADTAIAAWAGDYK